MKTTQSLAFTILPRSLILRDGSSATIVPFISKDSIPRGLLSQVRNLLNDEILQGDTYPLEKPFTNGNEFAEYWFHYFGAVMISTLAIPSPPTSIIDALHVLDLDHSTNWADLCLGSFYIKPNYPGRASHVCNAGFVVSKNARNNGIGRALGEAYLDYAPKLGYTYSVFNLVFATNTASMRIWDGLGFDRIGKIPGAGRLKSYPGEYIDAIIYGKELGSLKLGNDGMGEDKGTSAHHNKRFEQIKQYLKTKAYPAEADRALRNNLNAAKKGGYCYEEKDGEERLLFKGKKVVSNALVQTAIARYYHEIGHEGVNKTTATVSRQYHWYQIKETVIVVVGGCEWCFWKDQVQKIPVKNITPNLPDTTKESMSLFDSPHIDTFTTEDLLEEGPATNGIHNDKEYFDMLAREFENDRLVFERSRTTNPFLKTGNVIGQNIIIDLTNDEDEHGGNDNDKHLDQYGHVNVNNRQIRQDSAVMILDDYIRHKVDGEVIDLTKDNVVSNTQRNAFEGSSLESRLLAELGRLV